MTVKVKISRVVTDIIDIEVPKEDSNSKKDIDNYITYKLKWLYKPSALFTNHDGNTGYYYPGTFKYKILSEPS